MAEEVEGVKATRVWVRDVTLRFQPDSTGEYRAPLCQPPVAPPSHSPLPGEAPARQAGCSVQPGHRGQKKRDMEKQKGRMLKV